MVRWGQFRGEEGKEGGREGEREGEKKEARKRRGEGGTEGSLSVNWRKEECWAEATLCVDQEEMINVHQSHFNIVSIENK